MNFSKETIIKNGTSPMTSSNVTSLDGPSSLPEYADSVLVAVGTTIAMCGFLGNMMTIATILLDGLVHRAVYMAVACLAFADILYILVQSVRLLVGRGFKLLSTSIKVVILSFASCVVCSSAIHNVFLSSIRYGMIVHPILTQMQLSSLRVFGMSIGGWTMSIAIGCCYGYYNFIYYAGEITDELDAVIQVLQVTSTLVVPIIFFLVFFLGERRALQKSLLPSINENKRRLSNMIKFVIVTYVLCLTPYFVTDVLRLIQERHKIMTEDTFNFVLGYLVPISKVFMMLNPSINPFIYFLYAKSWQYKLCRKRRRGECSSS